MHNLSSNINIIPAISPILRPINFFPIRATTQTIKSSVKAKKELNLENCEEKTTAILPTQAQQDWALGTHHLSNTREETTSQTLMVGKGTPIVQPTLDNREATNLDPAQVEQRLKSDVKIGGSPVLPGETEHTSDDSMAEVLRIARLITTVLTSTNDMRGDTTIEQVDSWRKESRDQLGYDIVYDAETLSAMGLRDFEKKHWESNDKLLKSNSLKYIIQQATKPLNLKGETSSELRKSLKNVSNRTKVIDIVSNGQRKFLTDEFKPNGGKETSYGGSYKSMRAVCNNTLLKLVEKGRALVFTEAALEASGEMASIHINKLVWAEKTDTPDGRTCLHGSAGSRNFPSLNDSIDFTKSDTFYPPPNLPTLPDIAELACQQQAKHPGEVLSGATVDISGAYNQISQTVDSALTHGTRLRVHTGSSTLDVIVIYLVTMFGYSRAGNIYCQCAQAIDEVHNMGLDTRRSTTYIDDGLLIDHSQLIHASVAEYIEPAEKLFGKDGVINKSKVKIWPTQLEGIGWHFNFITWTVQPKSKGMAKILFNVFDRIPIGAESVDEKDLEKATGVLNWYAAGIPAGQSYVSSLYACKKRIGQSSRRILLTREAKADLTWWRALILAAFANPNALAASINSVRRVKTPSLYIRTDASSSIGGGAVVSQSRGGPALPAFKGDAIRWTSEELSMFMGMGVSINVLEYYVVVYYILLWSEEFKGLVLHIECDNTSAVSWLVKSRANHSPAADSLAKLFSLFCLRMNICIVCTHIPGVDNVVADFLSRNIPYRAQDADDHLADGDWRQACTRQELCRRLLKLSVTEPEAMHGPNALELLTRLL